MKTCKLCNQTKGSEGFYARGAKRDVSNFRPRRNRWLSKQPPRTEAPS